MIRIEGIYDQGHKFLIIEVGVPNVSKQKEEEIVSSFFNNIFDGWGFNLKFTPAESAVRTSIRLTMAPLQNEQYRFVLPAKSKELTIQKVIYGYGEGDLARMDQKKILDFLFDP